MKEVRGILIFFALGLIFCVTASAAFAQGSRRIGVIDIEAGALQANQRDDIVERMRQGFAARLGSNNVASATEVGAALVERNEAKEALERQKNESRIARTQIDGSLDSAQQLYRSSKFDEATRELSFVFSLLDKAILDLDPGVAIDGMRLLAACAFFLGQESRSKSLLKAMLDLDPSAQVNPQRFPPSFIKIFEQVQKESRFDWAEWAVPTPHENLKFYFLGREIPAEERGSELIVKLPIQHPSWGEYRLLITRSDSVPQIVSISDLPTTLSWVELKDKRKSTSGLFNPILGQTPPPEIKSFASRANVTILFLGSASQNEDAEWVLRGQWLELSTSRLSPIENESSADLASAVTNLVEKLVPYIAPDGHLKVQDILPGSSSGVVHEQIGTNGHKPFYKTWWFWTAVGVVAVGTGVGTYFAVAPSDEIRFKVEAVQ